MKINSRDILIGHISDGIDNTQVGDNSNKDILVRGCDPEMGRRAIELLSPILGNPEMLSVTNDDDFKNNATKYKKLLVSYGYKYHEIDDNDKMNLFIYDISEYKDNPDWLNSDNWANPDLWDK